MIDSFAPLLGLQTRVEAARLVAAFVAVHRSYSQTELSLAQRLKALAPLFVALPRAVGGLFLCKEVISFLQIPKIGPPDPAPPQTPKAPSKEKGSTPAGCVNTGRVGPDQACFLRTAAVLFEENKKAGARAEKPYVQRLSTKSRRRTDTAVEFFVQLLNNQSCAQYISERIRTDRQFKYDIELVAVRSSVTVSKQAAVSNQAAVSKQAAKLTFWLLDAGARYALFEGPIVR